MKKIVLVMIVALMGIAMNAQQPRHHKDHGSPEQMVERRVEKLAKVLELTEAQKAEVSKIYSQEMETMKQEHRSMSPEGQQQARPDESARKARHEHMKARRAETDAKADRGWVDADWIRISRGVAVIENSQASPVATM